MFVFAPPLLPHVRLALRKEDSVETPLGRFQVRAAQRIGRTLARRLRALAGEANFADVLAALEQGSVERILEALNLTVLTGAVEDAQASVAELVVTGADIGRRDLPLAVRAQLPSSTQIVSAFIEPMIAARGAELVRLVTESQRKTIQEIIAESFRLGRPLTETASAIMETVGLLPQHAKAVQRLRATLLEQGATASRAATTAQGYANRLLRVRAMNIARTESMMALSAGQQEAWDVADRTNLIDGATAQRVWTVFRPCPFICAPIPARGPVGLREPFIDGRGLAVMHPPSHPGCRCVVNLILPPEEV